MSDYYQIGAGSNLLSVSFVGNDLLTKSLKSIVIPGMNLAYTETKYKNQRILAPNRTEMPEKDEIIATFVLDDDTTNWLTIFDWMEGLRESTVKLNELVIDIIVFFYTPNRIPKRKFIYSGCFPTMLSDITVDLNTSEVEPLDFVSNFVVNNIYNEKM